MPCALVRSALQRTEILLPVPNEPVHFMSRVRSLVLALLSLPLSVGRAQSALDPVSVPAIVAKALEIARDDKAMMQGIGADARVPTDPHDGIRTLLTVAAERAPTPAMTATLSERLVAVPVDSVFRCASTSRAPTSCRMTRDGHFLSIRRVALNTIATELTVWVSRSSLHAGHFDGVTMELVFGRDADGAWRYLRKSPTYRFSS